MVGGDTGGEIGGDGRTCGDLFSLPGKIILLGDTEPLLLSII